MAAQAQMVNNNNAALEITRRALYVPLGVFFLLSLIVFKYR